MAAGFFSWVNRWFKSVPMKPSDSRLIPVDSEDRFYSVKSENRFMPVKSEDRFHSVQGDN